MSRVQTSKQALEIARDFLETAGVSFNVITKKMDQKETWLVEATTMMGVYRIIINKETGEVLEYGSIE